jgi:uncharacterized membrane protein
MNLKKTILTAAVTTTGLNAGLLYAYQVSVIPAFKTLADKDYIASMQAINAAIQNPVFVPLFLGAGLFLPLGAYLEHKTPGSARFRLLVAAALLYIVGALGITFAANVPLNDTLAQFSLQSATVQQAAAARTAFENPWNTWHLIRTLASIGALVLGISACLASGSKSSSLAYEKTPGASLMKVG